MYRKKDEICRLQLIGDVDAALTSREFADLINQFEINWDQLIDSKFDKILGESSGSAALFGVSGGVTEGIIRFLSEKITKIKPNGEPFTQLRGLNGIRNASFQIGNQEIKVAICNGIANARELIEHGNYSSFHFIEVMACPYGCIGGGGQPLIQRRSDAILRAKSLYTIDQESIGHRCPTDNLEVQYLYKEYLGNPYEGLSLEKLHTSYNKQTSPFLEMKRKSNTLPIVAYGSASGNSSRFARIFAGYIGTIPTQLNMCQVQTLSKRSKAIFFCSTFGSGEFPMNASKFISQLKESNENLNNLEYALCSLGSKDYPLFCAAGRTLDQLLINHGAKRIFPTVEIDSSTDDRGEHDFELWSEELIKVLGLSMPEVIVSPSYIL